MPIAATSAIGPCHLPSIDLIPSMVSTPSVPPTKVVRMEASCLTCGRISTAAAPNTTPAARCCSALSTVGEGRRHSVISAPMNTANTGMKA